ncbi:hypothetical protein [Xenorhabdus ishibashii]|uniref:Type III secretion system effector and immunogenic protein OspC2 n=1 Tax=Xenorhabdus ishibashii TaxID=1034471 RepID=A0A2D0KBY4_9GAMM|nr:hypothetical protein [Xenorhabdus ishibashii]PHM60974.1 type III secretion system effector and immunogenic protein OspC2 [Xenorhabdus ishibashii]
MDHDEKEKLELRQRKAWDKYRECVRSRWNTSAINRMMENGSRWRLFFPQNLHAGMQHNIENLRHQIQMQPLSDKEQQFADVFMKKDFFIVHASDVNLINNNERNLLIYSRHRLQEKGIKFPTHHSSVQDILGLGNDDYVFFSLEVGYTLKKPLSIFGANFYRIPYRRENMALRHSSMTLIDQIKLKAPDSRMLEKISQQARTYLKTRGFVRENVHFCGIDNCLEGLLYSIILETRNLGRLSMEKDVNLILSARTDDEMNRVINGLFRPEVRVPRMVGIPNDAYQAIMNKRF